MAAAVFQTGNFAVGFLPKNNLFPQQGEANRILAQKACGHHGVPKLSQYRLPRNDHDA
jgi:hypothetical protein